ncbi:uncharacterized protein CC84DRAFT_1171377 [Paraphaeosphaeria sporulosa]|uniref:RING-type domain-containing protein n=1 Tax=Paraphaeosphaeria sporulosa TaxID=1460663 RepID=A0A177D0P2_9PLEO|nr:uncharacterized protein CC84DRAFT_1171377 [Paraphaeosphaeria sporulosa]OAG12700.1 hypothetical protein CC84DRAFT_1171377 [Paraphaeosphaeria sporulosa]
MNAGPEQRQVIDLVSDDEDDLSRYGDDRSYEVDALPEFELGGPETEEDWEERNWGGLGVEGAARLGPLEQDYERDFIDFGPNDFDQPDLAPAVNNHRLANAAPNNLMNVEADIAESELVTVAVCLQMVLDILPDISVDHVLALIADQTQDNTRTSEACQRIVTQLLDGEAYPKEEEEASRKRKRQRSFSEFEEDDGEGRPHSYMNDVGGQLADRDCRLTRRNPHQETDVILFQQIYLQDHLLRNKYSYNEFVYVPVRHINLVIKQQKTLYKAYGVIDQQLREYDQYDRNKEPFRKVHSARTKRNIEASLIQRGSQVPKELQAAKKKSDEAAVKRRKAEDALREEENNIREAVLAGEMTECQCCFDEFPLNRMVGCGGATMHFLCRECVKNYVESEIGSSRCRPICFADSKCGGNFTRQQLQDCLTDTTFDRLEHMQQMQDLEGAGLDLDECPFCDFKQICPSVDEDKEFRCLNPKCRKTSCRLCQKETHIPLTCEEVKKNEKLTVRHDVEEAMSAALIRNCNKCKKPFIKQDGCNKMLCPQCGNSQCYVCSKDIKDYNHFSDHNVGRGGCQLHDNVEDRHEQEVKKAADEALAKAKAENPELSEADLMIQVSDRVKQSEQQRLGRAQEAVRAFPYHMVGGALINRAPLAAPAPAAAAAAHPQYPLRTSNG